MSSSGSLAVCPAKRLLRRVLRAASEREEWVVTQPAWKRYENDIADLIRRRAVGAVTISTDVEIEGRLSKVGRQVDIFIEGNFAGIANARLQVLFEEGRC